MPSTQHGPEHMFATGTTAPILDRFTRAFRSISSPEIPSLRYVSLNTCSDRVTGGQRGGFPAMRVRCPCAPSGLRQKLTSQRCTVFSGTQYPRDRYHRMVRSPRSTDNAPDPIWSSVPCQGQDTYHTTVSTVPIITQCAILLTHYAQIWCGASLFDVTPQNVRAAYQPRMPQHCDIAIRLDVFYGTLPARIPLSNQARLLQAAHDKNVL